MIKGVLFDFNGTLLFDSDKHVMAFQRFFEKRGLPIPSDDEVFWTFGRTNRDIFKVLYRADATDAELDSYGREKEADYRNICLEMRDSFKLVDGACEMFDYLKENGIPFNIATGSPLDNLEFYYEHLGLGKWIEKERIVYGNNLLRGKPAPDFYIEAARRVGLDASECIVFEDALSGFKSARAAGAAAIYCLKAENAPTAETEDIVIEGNLRDFRDHLSIFRKHGIVK